jgi:hypothetical protein
MPLRTRLRFGTEESSQRKWKREKGKWFQVSGFGFQVVGTETKNLEPQIRYPDPETLGLGIGTDEQR